MVYISNILQYVVLTVINYVVFLSCSYLNLPIKLIMNQSTSTHTCTYVHDGGTWCLLQSYNLVNSFFHCVKLPLHDPVVVG